MGRIKELKAKIKEGTASEEEVAELEELQSEAGEEDPKKPETTTGAPDEVDEDAEVERIADALVSKATKKMEIVATKKLESVLAGIDKAAEKFQPVEVTKEDRFVVDKGLGRVSVDKLAEHKIELPGRKARGKQVTEVSGKTVHFLNALMVGDKQKLQILTEGTAANGGYLVPEEFANMIVEDLRDEVIMRQLADVMNVTTDTIHVPQLATRPKAAWRSEAAVKQTSTATFSEIVLTPYSLASIVTLSKELVADATLGVNGSIVNKIAEYIVRALAEEEDKAFWTGSGSGRPTGITQYTVGSRAKGSNFADTLIQLYHDLPQGHRNRAVWVGNSHVLTIVRQLKDSQNRYLVQNLGDTPFGQLLGRPIFEQNDLGNSELYFGDFSYYLIADREGVAVDTSDTATVGGTSAFENNLVHVRVEKRVDGELSLTSAVKKITGI